MLLHHAATLAAALTATTLTAAAHATTLSSTTVSTNQLRRDVQLRIRW